MPDAAITAARLWAPLEDSPAWATEVCALCSHPARDTLDDRLIDGVSRAAVAREFGVSPRQVSIHAAHMARQLATVVLARQEVKADRLITRVLDIDQSAKVLAEESEDGKTAVAALNTRLRAVDLLSKMTGLIQGDQVTNTRINAIVNVSGEELLKMAQDVLSTSGPPTPLLPPSKSHNPSSSRKAPKIIDIFPDS
ncbi:hypothetical protein UFOVP1287_40 [uncultured Caudovirales phage]|uniref:Uncharacterized protein n=1 Tax=uncultured Caudovirales phage TaxID=2100421 RepID=A0A6J5S9C9_9CAUD|nr:hypothetical protein UFOVP1287_40 [uncultured Caudovirales phage]CAB4205354.1 hypothetical protein UFOVP1408_73 [uncultured Caudovirales phage]